MMARLNPGALPTTILHHLGDGACRTIDELEAALGLTKRQVSDGAAKLAYRKYLCRMAVGCYQLTDLGLEAAASGEVITSGPIGPDSKTVRSKVRNTFRDRVWRSMRMRRQFTVGDLVADAATEADADPDNNVSRYLRWLRLAGYVTEMRARQPGTKVTSNGFKRYSLAKDTGPVAPAYRPKTGTLHDYNLGEDVSCRKK
ncbi:hypothetical protein [Shinella sp. HZN7]|uniref:hypothetical protein n=1 Tax=Shinella sp. (strain HZN7) TaxID=879274 RepID=UPI000AECB544|nr:hypothetical protein [Shinella sp. HZN7]